MIPKKVLTTLFVFLLTFGFAKAQLTGPIKCDTLVQLTLQADDDTQFVYKIYPTGHVNATGATAPSYLHSWIWAENRVITKVGSATNQKFTRYNMGDVFGIANDDSGNVFLGASRVFHPNPTWGHINDVGGTNNGGSIFKIRANSIHEFVQLPNRGQGLGELAYNPRNKVLYATNQTDGKIYIIDASAATYSSWDPNFDGLSYFQADVAAQDPNVALPGQRPFAIEYYYNPSTNKGMLYYSRIIVDNLHNSASGAINSGSNVVPAVSVHNEIWSVELSSTGIPVSATETLVITIPHSALAGAGASPNTYSSPVTDLEMSDDGKTILLAERVVYDRMLNSIGAFGPSNGWYYAHSARLMKATRNNIGTNIWTLNTNVYSVGNGAAAYNSSGGCDFSVKKPGKADTCNNSVFVSMDGGIINNSAVNLVYGIQNFPFAGSVTNGITANPYFCAQNTFYIDGDGDTSNTSSPNPYKDKSHMGDVEVLNCRTCGTTSQTVNHFCDSIKLRKTSDCCGSTITGFNGLSINNLSSINYNIIGGTMTGYTSNCNFTNVPALPSSSGTLIPNTTFGPCNFTSIAGQLQPLPNNSSGIIIISWTIHGATEGQVCTLTDTVHCMKPPISKCDDFKRFDTYDETTNSNVFGFGVTNSIIPNSPICQIKVTVTQFLTTIPPIFTSASIQVGAGTPSIVSVSTNPFVLNMPPGLNTGSAVTIKLFYPAGTNLNNRCVNIEIIHCDSNKCKSNYCFKRVREIDQPNNPTAKQEKAQGDFEKIYLSAWRVYNSVNKGVISTKYPFKYIQVTLSQSDTNARILAVSAGKINANVKRRGIMDLEQSRHDNKTALFELPVPVYIDQVDSTLPFLIVTTGKIQSVKIDYLTEDFTNIGEDSLAYDQVLSSVNSYDTKTNYVKALSIVQINPNPTSGKLNIYFSSDVARAQVNFKITNASGGTVISAVDPGGATVTGLNSILTDVSSFAPGTYFISITVNGVTASGSFIKN